MIGNNKDANAIKSYILLGGAIISGSIVAGGFLLRSYLLENQVAPAEDDAGIVAQEQDSSDTNTNTLPDVAPDEQTDQSIDRTTATAQIDGFDMERRATCTTQEQFAEEIETQMMLGNELFGVSGTPGNVLLDTSTGTYLVISGAYPLEAFSIAIDARNNTDSTATTPSGDESAATPSEETEGETSMDDAAAMETDETTSQTDETTETPAMNRADNAAAALNAAYGADFATGTVSDDEVASVIDGTLRYGADDATLVILEYSDFMCPFCQRHSTDETLKNAVDAYDNVAKIFHHFPVQGVGSTTSAYAVACIADQAPADIYYDRLNRIMQTPDARTLNSIGALLIVS